MDIVEGNIYYSIIENLVLRASQSSEAVPEESLQLFEVNLSIK